MTLGKNIKKYRTEAGMTQEELGLAVGVSAQAVSKWENEESMPDTALLLPISDALSVSLDVLLGKEIRYKRDVYDSLCTIFRQNGGASRFSLLWEMVWNAYKGLWGNEKANYHPDERKWLLGRASEIFRDDGFVRISHDEKMPFLYLFPGEDADWSRAVQPDERVQAVFAALADADTVNAVRWLLSHDYDWITGYRFEFPVLVKEAGIPAEAAEKVHANFMALQLIFERKVNIDGTEHMLCGYYANYQVLALLVIAYEYCHMTEEYNCQADNRSKPVLDAGNRNE